MASKMVTDAVKFAEIVRASVETHRGDIAAALTELLSPMLKSGEHMPDAALLLTLIARLLESRSVELSTADDLNDSELADDPPLREKRDRAADQVRGVLVDLRDAVATAHGETAPGLLGLSDPPSFDPAVLLQEGERVREKLSDPKFKLPASKRRRGIKVDLDAFATDLEPGLGDLRDAIGALRREARESEQTMSAKRRALTAYQSVLSPGVGTIVELFRLGGRDDLADRVRPVERATHAADDGAEETGEGTDGTGGQGGT